MGPKRSGQFSKGTLRHMKFRERRGLSLGVIQRADPHERSPHAQKFEDGSQEETLKQERCARRNAWALAKHVHHKFEEKDKATFYSPSEVWCLPAPSFNENRENNGGGFWGLDADSEQEGSEFS